MKVISILGKASIVSGNNNHGQKQNPMYFIHSTSGLLTSKTWAISLLCSEMQLLRSMLSFNKSHFVTFIV